MDLPVKTYNPEYAVRRIVDRRQTLLKRARVPRDMLESTIEEAENLSMFETVSALKAILDELTILEAEVFRLGFELVVCPETQSMTWRSLDD